FPLVRPPPESSAPAGSNAGLGSDEASRRVRMRRRTAMGMLAATVIGGCANASPPADDYATGVTAVTLSGTGASSSDTDGGGSETSDGGTGITSDADSED